MKVTLDLTKLREEGKISQIEYDRLLSLSADSTSNIAFNILIGFGVVAVSGAALALVPVPATALVIGLLALLIGLFMLRANLKQWQVLTNIFILIGALLSGGGIIVAAKASLAALLIVTTLFGVTAFFARSSLLAVLATLMLSSTIGARTGYFHASYLLVIKEPTSTIILFSVLALLLFQLSKRVSADYERILIAASRTSVFLVNFGFWVGSLWGDRYQPDQIMLPAEVFAVGWVLALLATGIWAWRVNRRWVLNIVAVFAGIHFYTQWFEYLGATPSTVLLAGILALIFAVGLKSLNSMMKRSH